MIIGIDPGTAITGWGIIRKKKERLVPVDYGIIRTSPDKNTGERLDKIYEELSHIIRRNELRDMAIEKVFFNVNVKTALSVGQARGICILAAVKNNLSVYEYNPSQIKQTIVGYGKARKIEVALKVKEILLLDEIPKPDDVTDALAAAICHAYISY